MFNVHSAEKLNREIIDDAIEVISTATDACDYKKSTQYYYEGTKFFSYSSGELASSDLWIEVKGSIEQMFEKCNIKNLLSEIVNTEVKFSPNFESAAHISEYKKLTEIDGVRKYQSHYVETTNFGVVEGKLVVLESHVNFLVSERVN
jgi:hypothetical protein